MTFTRTTAPAAITKVNVDVGSARTFTLSAIPGVADITSFFMFYRIDSVVVQYNLITPNISGSTPFPRIYTAVDPGSATTPTTLDTVTAYSNVQQYQLGTSRVTFTRQLKPTPLVSSSSQIGITPTNPWINTSSTGIIHYGLLEWLAPYNTVSNTSTVVEYSVKYTFTCKGAK